MPPFTFTVPLLPVFLPTEAARFDTVPLLIVRLPVPLLPILREELFVQVPPFTFTVPVLPASFPI